MPAVGLKPEDLSRIPPAGLGDKEMASESGVLRGSPGGQEEVGVSLLRDEKVTEHRRQNCLIICWSSSPRRCPVSSSVVTLPPLSPPYTHTHTHTHVRVQYQVVMSNTFLPEMSVPKTESTALDHHSLSTL